MSKTRKHRVEFSITEPGESMPRIGLTNRLSVKWMSDLYQEQGGGWRVEDATSTYIGHGETKTAAILDYLRDRLVSHGSD